MKTILSLFSLSSDVSVSNMKVKTEAIWKIVYAFQKFFLFLSLKNNSRNPEKLDKCIA